MSDETPNPPAPENQPVDPNYLPEDPPVLPAGVEPVPAAQPQPIYPQEPVSPQQPIYPQQPVPPATPPAPTPVPPGQTPGFDTVQLHPNPANPQPQTPGFETVELQPGPAPINQPAPVPAQQPAFSSPPPNNPAPLIGAAAGAVQSRGPATSGPRRAGSRYVKPQVKDEVSVLSIFLAILAIVMLVLAVAALLPKSLIHIDGYPADQMSNKEPKNLLFAGQEVLKKRNKNVSFTEKEVNEYLNFRLLGKQEGMMGSFMKVRGIYVDLRPNEAEIFVERSIPVFGRSTISSVVRSDYNDQKHEQIWRTGGGSIGKIPMKGKNLQPVLEAFLRMSRVGDAEMDVMGHMADVKLEEDKITLISSIRNR